VRREPSLSSKNHHVLVILFASPKPALSFIMLFNSTAVTTLLALCSFSSAASLPHKRSAESDIVLYAYGSDLSGDGPNGGAIFYADGKIVCTSYLEVFLIFETGLAYIGSTAFPSWATVATNVTFTLDPDSTTTAWTISPNGSAVTFNATESLYIVPTTGSFTQVGFASSNDSMPTGAVTTGFAFFGTSVAYTASDSDYELMFWASATNTSGIWALYWNAAAAASDMINGSFPVTVKTTAPTVLSA
jgi:hypothetical protein